MIRALLFAALAMLVGCTVDGDPSPGEPGTYGLYDGHAYRCHGVDQASASICGLRQFDTCEADGAGCQWSYVLPGPVVNGMGTCSRTVDIGSCWVLP